MAKSNKEHVVWQRLCLHKLNKNSKKVWASLGPCQNKGITLVALMVTVIVLLIITTAGISTSLDRFEINNYRKMKNDLELLEDKVSDYYLKYEGLPVLRTSDSNIEVFNYKEYIKGLTNTNQEPATNANDNDIYYIIDLEALGNITLNYGKDFEKYKSNNVVQNVDTDIYIINEESHTIYYVKGIKMDNVTYHYIKRDEQISDDVPPTAPEIKVVEQNTSKIVFDIIPGKSGKNIISTYYKVLKYENEDEIIPFTEYVGKLIRLTDLETGKYKIVSNCKFNNIISMNDSFEFEINKNFEIGDYVDYKYDILSDDEINLLKEKCNTYSNSSYSSDIKYDDFKWRILDIKEDGTIYLISDKSSTWKLGLKGVKGYTNAVYLLNNVCGKLYSNKIMNIEARSINEQDIINLLTEKGKNIIKEYSSTTLRGKIVKYGFTNQQSQITYDEKSGYYPYIEELNLQSDDNIYTNDEDMQNRERVLAIYKNKNNLILTSKDYLLDINDENFRDNANDVLCNANFSTNFWIANRVVNIDDSYAIFGIRMIAGERKMHEI